MLRVATVGRGIGTVSVTRKRMVRAAASLRSSSVAEWWITQGWQIVVVVDVRV